MSADVSVEWVPYKVIPQDDQSGFDVVLHGERLTDPMPEAVAVVLATTLAKEAASQGKLGIVARCTGVGEIVYATSVRGIMITYSVTSPGLRFLSWRDLYDS